ncbi:hypothetical protein GCM10019059_19740 [Camelimonas fluminis]|nr:hypothetical protein GCM10019059_19740 [Camelimonas fluminis]
MPRNAPGLAERPGDGGTGDGACRPTHHGSDRPGDKRACAGSSRGAAYPLTRPAPTAAEGEGGGGDEGDNQKAHRYVLQQ